MVLGRDLVVVPKLIHPLPPAVTSPESSPEHHLEDTWMQVLASHILSLMLAVVWNLKWLVYWQFLSGMLMVCNYYWQLQPNDWAESFWCVFAGTQCAKTAYTNKRTATACKWPWVLGLDLILQFLAYLVILCPHSPLHAREYLVLLGLVKYICDSFQLLTPAIFFGLRRSVVMKSWPGVSGSIFGEGLVVDMRPIEHCNNDRQRSLPFLRDYSHEAHSLIMPATNLSSFVENLGMCEFMHVAVCTVCMCVYLGNFSHQFGVKKCNFGLSCWPFIAGALH